MATAQSAYKCDTMHAQRIDGNLHFRNSSVVHWCPQWLCADLMIAQKYQQEDNVKDHSNKGVKHLGR